jgi:antitoxin (DNA-binding transcriptional repressor) of toxin-antitoxin stability system
MTLTILDPRSGETVTISVKNIPVVRQPVAAKVVTHPRFGRPN